MNQKMKILLSGLLLASAQVFAAPNSLTPEQFGRTKLFVPDYVPAAHNNVSRLKNVERNDDAVGLTVSLAAFWEQILSGTRSGLELAKGFSIDGSTSTAALGVDTSVLAASAGNSVAFNWNRVEHRRVGVSGSGCYSLDNFYDGLWVAGNVTVMYERNRLDFTVADSVGAGQGANFKNYLAGSYADGNQAALTALKLDSARVSGEVGVNNVDLAVGFRIVNNDNATVNIMGVAVVPTAFDHKREFLFQPTPGVRNFKAGAGVCAMVRLVNDDAYAINFYGHADWKYGFTRKGEKIIPQHKTTSWAHYRLVATGAAVAQPLANVLNTVASVDVEYKNEFSASASACFERGGFGLAAGYRFFYAQEKTLTVNGMEASTGWKFVAENHTASTAALTGNAIVNSDFYSTVPSQVTHCVSADLTYLFSEWEFPLLVGLSGSYNFAHRRSSTPEYWGVGVKAGLSF